MQKIIVDERNDGKKLINFLTTKYPDLKLNSIYKSFRKKDIKINGKRISSDTTVHHGDLIELFLTDNILFNHKDLTITVIYEDDNIVVFNKPKNIEVEGKNSLTDIMKDKYEYLKPCHRIDRNTVGAVLYAKNEESLEIIKQLFINRNIEKHYVACCYGIAKKEEHLNAYLFKDRKKSIVYISDIPKKGYTQIFTSYKLIEKNEKNKLSLLDVTLHTGKTHQIRAHLAHIGLPILGDGKYGSYKINQNFKVNSQLLCSYSIGFKDIENNKLAYLNNKTIKLKDIPYYDFIKSGRN